MFTRFPAFHGPPIAVIAAGFLKTEGLRTDLAKAFVRAYAKARRHAYEDIVAPPPEA